MPALCQKCSAILERGSPDDRFPDRSKEITQLMRKIASLDQPEGDDAVPSTKRFTHHRHASSIKEAAEAGCYICSDLWDPIAPETRSRLLETDQPADDSEAKCSELLVLESTFVDQIAETMNTLEGEPQGQAKGYMLSAWIERSGFRMFQPWILSCSLYLIPHIDSRMQLVEAIATKEAGEETTDAVWKLAKSWMDGCVADHVECQSFAAAGTNWYPKRLLSFKLNEAAGPVLIETGDVNPEGPYLTLSQFGDLDSSFRLTADNLANAKSAIPTESLSKTVSDALVATKELGFKYLWVDSMCTIEDEVRPDSLEKVFSHSFCTLYPAGATTDADGLFLHRSKKPKATFSVETHWNKDDDSATGRFQVASMIYHWVYQVSQAPLSRIGKHLLERFFAPRVLYFSKTQLLYECGILAASEQYPNGMPQLIHNALGRFKHLRPFSEKTELPTPKIVWSDIIMSFSQASFPSLDDKAIALGTVAKKIQSMFSEPEEYFAGLWKSHLVGELLWEVTECAQYDGSPSKRLANENPSLPSFSWLSVDGIVRPPGSLAAESLFSVLETSSVTPEEQFGPLKSGMWIKMAGNLKEARLRRAGDSPSKWFVMIPGKEKPEDEELSWLPIIVAAASPDAFINEKIDTLENVYALPIHGPAKDFIYIEGLLLVPRMDTDSTKEKGSYIRFGKFQVLTQDAIDLFLQKVDTGVECPNLGIEEETGRHIFKLY